jgi:hypothetical protein
MFANRMFQNQSANLSNPFSQSRGVGSGAFQPYGSTNYINGSSDFLRSNSIIARIAFLILAIFIFVVVLRLGIILLSWAFSPSKSPTLIDGMIDAKEMHIISQDPNNKGNIPIIRSDNERGGIEFTWSTWIYINDLTYKSGQYRHIFHKGNDRINYENENAGMVFPNNAPGLYIGPNKNELVVVMNTFKNITEQISIDNIPVKKWVNVIIRCNGNILDTFINGTLTRRHILKSVAKQNYGDVYISMNGGFDGYTSHLKYYDYAIGTSKVQDIIRGGPNLKMKSDNLTQSKNPQYLAMRWYFSDANSSNVV